MPRKPGKSGRAQGDTPVRVVGTFLLGATTIVSASQQLVWTPGNMNALSFGTRLADLTHVFERIRWQSLKIKFANAVNTNCTIVGLQASGENAGAAPAVTTAAEILQMARVGVCMQNTSNAVTLNLNASDLNPTPGFQEVDSGIYWALYAATMDGATRLSVAGTFTAVVEYDILFSGAVDPLVFMNRLREQVADEDAEGYVQVGPALIPNSQTSAVINPAVAAQAANVLPQTAVVARKGLYRC
jgi:hypothetical protein